MRVNLLGLGETGPDLRAEAALVSSARILISGGLAGRWTTREGPVIRTSSESSAPLPALSAQERISLVLFDGDDRQALSDRYGHAEVDRLLARPGSLIQERCGAGEMGARLGGDEFALTLLEDEPTEVVREVEHIRGRFGEEAAGATVSVGICDGRTLRRATVHLSLLEAADSALADAKEQCPGGRLRFFRFE